MWQHWFHAICPKGHKRNFTWNEYNKDYLISVSDYCHLCGKVVKYIIKKYFEEPKELK